MTAKPHPPKVAVLMATYNGAEHLEAQVASILAQTGILVHLFARDDGSRDGTPELLDNLAAAAPGQMTVVHDEVGPTGSAAGNFFRLLALVDLGEFAFVAFADQDDIWFPDKLRRAVETMRAEDAAGYSCDLLAYDESTRRVWLIGKTGRDADLDYLFQGASAGCTYVVSASAARMVRDVMAPLSPGIWAHGLSHDWAIYAICRSRGAMWCRDPRPGLLYRQHAHNEYGARPGLGGLIKRLQAVRADWYREHVLWLRNVVAMTPAERAVFDAIERGDRLWLARNAPRFRRSGREARMLAASFAIGLF